MSTSNRIRLIFITLCSFGSTFSFGQNKIIEVAVNETVKLKSTSAEYALFVQSTEEQRDAAFNTDESYYNYEEEENPYYMEFENEKEQQKAIEAYEKRQAKKEKERQDKIDAFKPFTAKQLKSMLEKNGLNFKMDVNSGYVELDDYSYAENDTSFTVTLPNEAAYLKLMDAVKDLPLRKELGEVFYESIDSQHAKLLPEMSKKAKAQAAIMASSIGKKVGNIVHCSNINPSLTTAIMMGQDVQLFTDYYGNRGLSPFQLTQTSYVQMVYQFEMLD